MTKDYGQFCGLARASRVLGERWALLIVRDLSVGPRRFMELEQGLPGVPTSVLTTRLRELEEMDIVERRPVPRPARGVFYALTPYGEQLTPVLDSLGRWGAQRMSAPAPDEVITSSSLAAALRAAFRPGVVETRTTFLVHAGPVAAWAVVDGDDVAIEAGRHPDAEPDLIIHAGPQLRLLLAGQLSPADAITSGAIDIEGPRSAFALFARAFHVPLDDSAIWPGTTTNTEGRLT